MRTRVDALRQDELWKEANARLCPHCQRCVVHGGGCDLMICGRDFHQGNAQDGCGAEFRYSAAAPYESAMLRADAAECDVRGRCACGQEALFECIHCKAFRCCRTCLAGHTAGHAFRVDRRAFWNVVD